MTALRGLVAPREAYVRHELDAAQVAVVQRAAGESFVVVGAPGTGKTTALVELVAHRVEVGRVATNDIIVLTGQRLAANRLREALAARLRRPTNGPLARTPMSLALDLATEGAAARGDVAPRLLTGAEQDRIIATLLEAEAEAEAAEAVESDVRESGASESGAAGWPHTLGPEVRASRVFRNELRDLIDRSIDAGIDAHELEQLARQHGVPEWQAVARFWATSLTDVLDAMRYGFADAAEVMRQATVAVAQGAALTGVKAIVVDDAQELTAGAIALLTAASRHGIPLVMFGNPDETATAFRGAVPSVLGRFGSIVGSTGEPMVLPHVHRHGSAIRGAVARLEARIGAAELGTQRKATASPNMSAGSVVVIEKSQRAAELAAVARAMREAHVRDGVGWHRMAVVVRQGALVESVARQLAIHEVPTRTLVSDQALRDQPLVREFIAALRLSEPGRVVTPAEAEAFLSGEMGGLSAVDTRRLRLALRHHDLIAGGDRTGPELVRDGLTNVAEFAVIDSAPARAATRMATLLEHLREQRASGATIEELLWTAWNGSVLPRELAAATEGTGLVAEEAHRKLDTVLALFASARRFVEREADRTPEDFIHDLLTTDVPEDTLAPSSSSDAVIVCTPPSVIGAEYDLVAVVAVQEGVWPNLRLRGQLLHAGRFDDLVGSPSAAHPDTSSAGSASSTADARLAVLHDELRMFVLACSRARHTLIVSATNSADVMTSPFLKLVADPEVATSDAGAHRAQLDTEIAADEPNADGSDAISGGYPLSLSGITGFARRELVRQFPGSTESSAPTSTAQAEALARALARLAEAGVAGANPDDWYGLAGPSTERDIVDEADRAEGLMVHVSPSRLEAWERNQLGWFIDSTVGGEQTVATGLGTLVHKVFEDVGNELLTDLSVESLWAAVDKRWHELTFEAEWLGERERTRAQSMVKNLATYLSNLRARNVDVVGVECSFSFDVGVGRLVGRIDRVHRNPDGTVTIVDLKTGRMKMSEDDVAENLQLECYQLALVRDEIRETVDSDSESNEPRPIGDQVAAGAESGGAGILMVDDKAVKKTRAGEILEVLQPAIERGGAAQEAIEQRVAQAAEGMSGSSFTAVIFTREERGEFDSTYAKRIHTVSAVSA
jgi:superfamily I DNA/RNA helicase/RecB family exonuclease